MYFKKSAKTKKDQNYESFVTNPDQEEDSININESDIICINPNNYNSNVFFENNAPFETQNSLHIPKSSHKNKTREVLDEFPNLKNIEKSEIKKILNERKNSHLILKTFENISKPD